MGMATRSNRIENLERILRELIEIHSLASSTPACQFRMWLDLAITETRLQIERTRMGTVH
jgi:hypothetical protein